MGYGLYTRALIIRWVWNSLLILRVRSEIEYQIFGQDSNMAGKIADFALKKDKGFRKQAAHPNPIFLGVTPPPFQTDCLIC